MHAEVFLLLAASGAQITVKGKHKISTSQKFLFESVDMPIHILTRYVVYYVKYLS
jgi:hypothetical protein